MISVCILTKNSARTLRETLESTRAFPEVLLLDNGSTDATLLIAQEFPNVKVHHSPFLGFGPLRNEAARLAAHDWILALDSDEVLSAPLIYELLSLQFEPKSAYAIQRHNFYNGKWIKGCGWHPEKVFRLYHRGEGRYSEAKVHESLLLTHLTPRTLNAEIFHTPYRTTTDFLHKMQHYSTLFAEEHKGKKSSFSKALFHGIFAFFKSYVLKGGLFLGKEGFLISLYNGNTTFYKYIKLWELTCGRKSRDKESL